MSAVNQKIKDSDFGVSTKSKADLYWRTRGFEKVYKNLRTPAPKTITEDPYKVILNRYQVKGVDFGNWVPIDMRYNYLVAAIVAIDDIEKITDIKFGKKALSLAFGARGGGRASAHFEPGNNTINITRYSRDAGRKNFSESGGVGALAHEYGHFLDYYFGTRVKNGSDSRALSGGRTTATKFTDAELADRGPWGMMSRLLQAIIWDGDRHTSYYNRVRSEAGDTEYWYRRNELFARAFEQYIQYKLAQRSIRNSFLTGQSKYAAMGDYYMRPAELKRITPLMDKLIHRLSQL